MRKPRGRFTLRDMMAVVAVIAVGLAARGELERRGVWLVDFGYDQVIRDEPLVNPTRVASIDGPRFVLEDGRVVLVEEGPLLEGEVAIKDPRREECVVGIQVEADGSATLRTRERFWVCGFGRREPLVRIPLFPRTTYLNMSVPVGTGRIVEGGGGASEGGRGMAAR